MILVESNVVDPNNGKKFKLKIKEVSDDQFEYTIDNKKVNIKNYITVDKWEELKDQKKM